MVDDNFASLVMIHDKERVIKLYKYVNLTPTIQVKMILIDGVQKIKCVAGWVIFSVSLE